MELGLMTRRAHLKLLELLILWLRMCVTKPVFEYLLSREV